MECVIFVPVSGQKEDYYTCPPVIQAGGNMETGQKTKSSADFKAMGAAKAIRHLDSSAKSGLSKARAADLLEKHGHNEIEEKRPNPALLFLSKFWGLTAWLLEAIIIISLLSQKYFDMIIVLALLFLNAAIGFVQEKNASDSIEALKRRLQVTSRTLRDGKWEQLPARELVPGDIIRIRTGDFVPADAIVISGEISADQSALTGESAAVAIRRDGLVYSGSIAVQGEATCIVVLTAARTYFGRTAQLVQLARPKLHIEEVISQVVTWLLAMVLVVLAIAFAYSLLEGFDPIAVLPLMLVLLLGAIPVALPAMFTVSMALGARELSSGGVLVTRLSAPDDAASMDILCVDKTGTMTMNKVAVASAMPLGGFGEDDAILYGALASREENRDSIDLAFIAAAKERNLPISGFRQKSFVPFSPSTRRTTAVVEGKEGRFTVMKGSVEVISGMCGLDAKSRRAIGAFVSGCAKNGNRALAVALSRQGSKPVLVGLVALYDPPRPDSPEVVSRLGELGVSVKMLTGDALPVAREIASMVGIGGRAISFSQIRQAGFGKAASLAEKAGVFAEIYPEDKYAIVKDFQSKGHIVGMTGDGVNDAPALKQAEVGIAVSSATDVAKGAASIVLTREGLSNMLEPIRVGRMMFRRINTWIVNKITKTILQVCFIVIAFILTGQYVISSSAMLLLVFMIDFVTISLSTDNVKWSRKPEKWDIGALVKVALALGSLLVAESLLLLHIGLAYLGVSPAMLSTFSFEILFYFTAFLIFVAREKGRFWESAPGAFLFSVIAIDMVAAAFLCTAGVLGLYPMPLGLTALVIAYSAFFSLFVNDWIKSLVLWDREG
ncbi:MAG: plasma-membrane proton-efflux P-type ATPase [Candidatus Micrarchaeia archaeon]